MKEASIKKLQCIMSQLPQTTDSGITFYVLSDVAAYREILSVITQDENFSIQAGISYFSRKAQCRKSILSFSDKNNKELFLCMVKLPENSIKISDILLAPIRLENLAHYIIKQIFYNSFQEHERLNEPYLRQGLNNFFGDSDFLWSRNAEIMARLLIESTFEIEITCAKEYLPEAAIKSIYHCFFQTRFINSYLTWKNDQLKKFMHIILETDLSHIASMPFTSHLIHHKLKMIMEGYYRPGDKDISDRATRGTDLDTLRNIIEKKFYSNGLYTGDYPLPNSTPFEGKSELLIFLDALFNISKICFIARDDFTTYDQERIMYHKKISTFADDSGIFELIESLMQGKFLNYSYCSISIDNRLPIQRGAGRTELLFSLTSDHHENITFGLTEGLQYYIEEFNVQISDELKAGLSLFQKQVKASYQQITEEIPQLKCSF